MEKTLIDWNNLTLSGQAVSTLHRQEFRSDKIKEISDVIDKSIVDNNKKRPRRKYLGGSSLGEECSRKIQYRYMGTEPDREKEFNAKTLRIFQFGHEIEDMKAEWIKQSGFDLRTVDKQGEQFGFSIADDQIKGHIDGVICAGPVELQYPMLWECKSANDKKFKEFVRVGVAKANPTYAAQIAVYQAYMDLHENPALFTVMNKNTSEIYYELVPFDKALAQKISDKGVQILTATKASEMLPRIAHNRDYFSCKWCEFNNTCWEQ
tara:strand:+ start:1329 stop:2120 length:792 start_codon:yes stop_codon:yes gene_type:complete